MKRAILTTIACIFCYMLFAQDTTPPVGKRQLNNVNLNAFGNASLVSINYERLLLISERVFLAGQIGGGYNLEGGFLRCILGCDPPENFLVLPHQVTGNYRIGKDYLEFGLGGALIKGHETQNYFLYPIVGIRIQPSYPKRFNFRTYASFPINMMDTNKVLFFPIGVSMGYCF